MKVSQGDDVRLELKVEQHWNEAEKAKQASETSSFDIPLTFENLITPKV